MSNTFLESKLKVPSGRVNKKFEDYIRRVYELNKDIVDKFVRESGTGLWGTHIDPLEYLQLEIEATMDYNNISVQDAIRTVGKTEAFRSKEERRLGNAINSLRKNPSAYKSFRLAWGWNRKIDWNMFEPTEEPNVYRMGNIYISFENSPKEIIITKGNESYHIDMTF